MSSILFLLASPLFRLSFVSFVYTFSLSTTIVLFVFFHSSILVFEQLSCIDCLGFSHLYYSLSSSLVLIVLISFIYDFADLLCCLPFVSFIYTFPLSSSIVLFVLDYSIYTFPATFFSLSWFNSSILSPAFPVFVFCVIHLYFPFVCLGLIYLFSSEQPHYFDCFCFDYLFVSSISLTFSFLLHCQNYRNYKY